jgi:glutamyl-tRNA synthetase
MTSPLPRVRVRFAPAPSGSLHVGNARTALFNWLFARHHGGAFILRIEDTDRSRVAEEHVAGVMDVLRWLGLGWDEGPDVGGPYAPYRQSERLERYREAVERLLAAGAAFLCFCTPEEVRARSERARREGRTPPRRDPCRAIDPAAAAARRAAGEPAVVRFAAPDEGETAFEDLVHGEIRTAHAEIEDFPLLRSDGTPLYVLASAVDDLAMDVTHVIRGEDLLAATPKQILLRRALGHGSRPAFAHLPLIVGANRQPLSKRHGETAVEWYRERGYLPEAMVNYLALLGWSPGDGTTERFTLEELVEAFSLEGVSRNPAAFDLAKLTALNGEKIRALDPADLAGRLLPFLVRDGVLPDPPAAEQRRLLEAAVPLVQTRLATLGEASRWLGFLFREEQHTERARALLVPANAELLAAAVAELEALPAWDEASVLAALDRVATRLGRSRRDAFQPVRAAVTFSTESPPLPESMALLGRERTLARLRAALDLARAA